MTDLNWLSIEIGYESPEYEDCTSKPPMQQVLEDLLHGDYRQKWTEPGSTTINGDPGTGDAWTALVLMTEINAAVMAAGEDDLVASLTLRSLFPEVWPVRIHVLGEAPTPTGEPGTRCKLVNDQWVNSRSYHLLGESSGLWPQNADPESAMVFATINWRCWPPA